MLQQLSRTLTLSLVALAPALVFAASPQVTRITPAGLTAGSTRQITILGERLADVTEIVFFDKGLKATSFEVVGENQIKCTVEADAQLNNNLYAFNLITKSGIANLRYLGVNRFPSIDEVEDNNEFEKPQSVSLRSTIDGTVRNEDVDYFAVELKQGQIVSVELEGLRHSNYYNFFDPAISIYNAERFEVASSDDANLLRQDCLCSYQAEADGRYVIEVRESAYGGNDDCLYRLHVSDQTRPVVMIPAGGRPGEMLNATLIDDLGNVWQESFQLPNDASPNFPIWSNRNDVQAPSPNYVRVIAMDNHIEAEPNGDMNTVAAVPQLPAAFHGVLQEPKDEDFFVFSAKKDEQFEIRSLSRSLLRSPADTVINVFKVGGNHIVGNDDSNGPDAFIDFKAPEDGNYAIRVLDHLGRGGIDFAYRIECTPKLPEVFPSFVDQQRLVAQTIEVPQGGRFAVEVNVNRRYIGGDATVSLESLPAGMTADPVVCPADRGSVPVTIRCTPDAAIAGGLAEVTAKITQGENNEVVGRFRQRVQLIRAQNDRDVWGYDADRAAVSVVEAAPFDIEVVQPGVPLVRDGVLNVKVKLHRKEGFTQPVGLRFLYNAPGMSANGSIQFANEVTEVEIPVTANGNARIGVWPMNVLAWSNTGRGDVKIASEPFNIEIADRLFEFAFNKSMAEQGKPVDVLIGAKLLREVAGNIEMEVLGIPPGTNCAATKLPFAPTDEQVVFKIDVPLEAKAGNFKTIVCRATVTSDAGVITQTNGNGEVQIDVPIVAQAPTAAMPEQPKTEQPAEPKPLTRLEQLRAMREGK